MCRGKRPTRAQSVTPKPAPHSHTPRTHVSTRHPNQDRKGHDNPRSHKSNQIRRPLFRQKGNNLCQDRARRASTSRPYRHLSPKSGPPPTPTLAIPPCSHPATRQKTLPHLRFILERPQRGSHPGIPQRSNVFRKSTLHNNRLHPSGTPQAQPRLPQRVRSSRCIHAHMGPSRGYPIGSIPCTKGYTR